MRNRNVQPVLVQAGSRGLFLNAAEVTFSDEVQSKILSIASELDAHKFVEEVVPGVNTLLVVYDSLITPKNCLADLILELWLKAKVHQREVRTYEVPVVYGGSHGEDLRFVAEHARLDIEQYIALHAESEFRVACVGAMPGFPYLTGLNPQLAVPRRSVPRVSLPGGAITIGGTHAGITPCTAPSGWHVIGTTTLSLFDASKEQPALLQPGDRIKFIVAGIEV